MPPGVYPRKGHTEETRRKIALGNTGKVFSDDRRKKIGYSNSAKFDEDLIKRVTDTLNECVCNVNAVLDHNDVTKNRYALVQLLKSRGILINETLRFLSNSIDYVTGKLILEYFRLNMRIDEISKRTGLGKKLLHNTRLKFQKVHGFSYNPSKNGPRENRQTKIEKFVESILVKNEIKCTSEYQFGNFFFDFHITGTTLLIEANGDYWHSNPSIYHDLNVLTNVQKSNKRRDNYKRIYASDMGFYVLYVWENDIKTRPDYVEELILKYCRRAYEKYNDI